MIRLVRSIRTGWGAVVVPALIEGDSFRRSEDFLAPGVGVSACETSASLHRGMVLARVWIEPYAATPDAKKWHSEFSKVRFL